VTALRAIATTGAVVVLLSIEGQAHRLDEYLQAARLSLVRERVAVELDLTPGVAVAPEIIAIIDRDADAAISSEEARAYGQTVMSDVRLTLDGHAVGVSLDRVEIPSAAELRAGLGTIAVRASGSVDRLGAGRHSLQFQNNHHPGGAAYLINALAPGDPAIRVVSQARDPIQREGRIEYEIRSSSAARWFWLFAVVACFPRQVATLGRKLRVSRPT
jgi:nickel/cobalt transporter (NicO) family protein